VSIAVKQERRAGIYSDALSIIGKSRVLVIDDNKTARAELKAGLQADGYEVTAVGGKIEAFAFLRTGSYDAVITNVQLRGGIGFEVIEFARRRSRPGTPVLVLSSLKQERAARRAMQVGATEYIAHPASPDEVVSKLRTLVA
jgi:DNA-binding response OmpR family regulator